MKTLDIQTVGALIANVGFPIFCVLALGLYIYKNEVCNREERKQTNEMLNNFALNLQANTQALNNLTDYIKENK